MSEPTPIRMCPNDELLLAYLQESLDVGETREIDAHVDGCDVCLDALAAAQSRLSRDAEMAGPIPDAVLRRMAAVPPQRAAISAGDPAAPSRATRRVRRLPVPHSFRTLAPLALAAGAVLVVASQSFWGRDGSPTQTRAVPMSQQVRVTAHEVPVRVQPNLQAEVVASLKRGDVVVVGGEEREWYRVVLPSGGEGWVEQRAFR